MNVQAVVILVIGVATLTVGLVTLMIKLLELGRKQPVRGWRCNVSPRYRRSDMK